MVRPGTVQLPGKAAAAMHRMIKGSADRRRTGARYAVSRPSSNSDPDEPAARDSCEEEIILVKLV